MGQLQEDTRAGVRTTPGANGVLHPTGAEEEDAPSLAPPREQPAAPHSAGLLAPVPAGAAAVPGCAAVTLL